LGHRPHPIERTMSEAGSLRDLQAMVDAFAHERDWERFHSPKNLAMSAAIEAAELMEHFQWTSAEDSVSDAEKTAIGEEMSDVLAYLLRLASVLDIDLADAFRSKIAKNAIKYPAPQQPEG
jgi:dCTP diphosphatase